MPAPGRTPSGGAGDAQPWQHSGRRHLPEPLAGRCRRRSCNQPLNVDAMPFCSDSPWQVASDSLSTSSLASRYGWLLRCSQRWGHLHAPTRPRRVNVVAVLLVLVSVVPSWLAQRLSEGTVRGAGAGAVAAR